jgi:hypothetical protein
MRKLSSLLLIMLFISGTATALPASDVEDCSIEEETCESQETSTELPQDSGDQDDDTPEIDCDFRCDTID